MDQPIYELIDLLQEITCIPYMYLCMCDNDTKFIVLQEHIEESTYLTILLLPSIMIHIRVDFNDHIAIRRDKHPIDNLTIIKYLMMFVHHARDYINVPKLITPNQYFWDLLA